MEDLNTDKIEFLFNQFTERCEDHRFSVLSIGQNIRFLFGVYLAAAVGSFGCALTIPEMTDAFIFASVYFSVLSVYLLARGFGIQDIPQKGLHPDELENDSGFIGQDLDMIKLGISESLKEDINTYKRLSDHLAKVGYFSVVMAVSFPFLTIFGYLLPEILEKFSCLPFLMGLIGFVVFLGIYFFVNVEDSRWLQRGARKTLATLTGSIFVFLSRQEAFR